MQERKRPVNKNIGQENTLLLMNEDGRMIGREREKRKETEIRNRCEEETRYDPRVSRNKEMMMELMKNKMCKRRRNKKQWRTGSNKWIL